MIVTLPAMSWLRRCVVYENPQGFVFFGAANLVMPAESFDDDFYSAVQGDRWDAIALAVYGDIAFAPVLAWVNGETCAALPVRPGLEVRLPPRRAMLPLVTA